MKRGSAYIIAGCLLAVCLSFSCGNWKCSLFPGHALGDQFTSKFEDCTLQGALRHIQSDYPRFQKWNFVVQNDRTFPILVFKDVLTREDLLRQIESQTSCTIAEAGNTVVITLPKEG